MKRKWKRWEWLAVLCAAAGGVLLAMLVPLHGGEIALPDFTLAACLWRFCIYFPICLVVGGLVFWAAIPLRWFCRWFFRWKIFRWWLLALGILLALVPLFYLEENWRGHRAWENYKREWEEKGEKFDFASFIPPPVPDDQNFALAPIVVSSYARCLDTNGHQLKPENRNVVNRLNLNLYRSQSFLINSNVQLLGWLTGKLTDLKAWQAYYRVMFITNRYPADMRMPPPPGFRGEVFPPAVTNEVNPENTNEVIEIEVLTNEFPIAAQPQTPAADVLLALSKYDGIIEELRQAAQRPLARFPLDYDTQPSYDLLLPHLSPLKECGQVLYLRAIAELENGQASKALDDMKLIVVLADSIHKEPFDMVQLTRMTLLNSAVGIVWEALATHRWTDAQIAEAQRRLAGLDLPSDYQFFIRATRARLIQDVDYLERSRSFAEYRKEFYFGYNDWGGGFWDRIKSASFYYFLPKGWFYFNKLGITRVFENSLLTENELSHGILSSNVTARSGDGLVKESEPRTARNMFVGMLVPAIGAPTRQLARTQAMTDMTAIACGLERYRLAHGEFPETLEPLSPQFIAKIPHDVINGQPMHYRRTDDGKFLLYSVGWNQTDEGGVPGTNNAGRPNLMKGDWVWLVSKD